MKKILFVLLIALCGVSFGKPISSSDPSDSTEVTAEVPVPEAANAVDCITCIDAIRKADYDPDLIDFFEIEKEQLEMELCIGSCMNK